MKVAVLPGDNGGCGTYRLIEPARAVSGVRPHWDIRTYAPRGEVKVHWHQKHGVVDVVFPNRHPWPDVMVMQRTGTPILAGVARFMQAKGTAVVADFDDAMWTIDKANIAYGAWNNPNRHKGQHWSWCDLVAERADLVTVTTEHLARRYGRHGRCVVLPNRIPDRWVVTDPVVPVGVGGWAGYLGTHPGDCKVSAPAATVFSEVRVMGEDPANMAAEWGTTAVTGIPSAPLGPEYYQGLSGLGTMLVGLRDTSFNKGKCLDASTLIPTDHGLIPIQEVTPQMKVWGSGGWSKVIATQHDLPRPGLQITTRAGRILRLTAEHRLMVANEWVEARTLRVGDALHTASASVADVQAVTAPWPADGRWSRRDGYDAYAFQDVEDGPRVTITPRWGRLLGLFIGDGSVARQNRQNANALSIHCDGQDADLIAQIVDDFLAIGQWPTTQIATTYTGQVLRRRYVQVSSSPLLRFLNSIGVVAAGEDGLERKNVIVPDLIMRSPRPVVAAFLSGLFEADGTVDKGSAQVSLTLKQGDTIRQVQTLLSLFGVDSSVRVKWNAATKGGVKRPYWKLTITSSSFETFVSEVGMLSARKRGRINDRLAAKHAGSRHGPVRNQAWRHDPIVEVTKCWVTPVDLQVEGEQFAAAGILSHNSTLKVLEAAAAGVPSIAAATPPHRALQRDHFPVMLATTPGEWLIAAKSMLDPDNHAAMQADIRSVMPRFLMSAQAEQWAQAWERAVNRRSGTRWANA